MPYLDGRLFFSIVQNAYIVIIPKITQLEVNIKTKDEPTKNLMWHQLGYCLGQSWLQWTHPYFPTLPNSNHKIKIKEFIKNKKIKNKKQNSTTNKVLFLSLSLLQIGTKQTISHPHSRSMYSLKEYYTQIPTLFLPFSSFIENFIVSYIILVVASQGFLIQKNVGFFYVLSIKGYNPFKFYLGKKWGGVKLYIKKNIMNYIVHDNVIVPPRIWQICKCNLNYDVMKKYPNLKKVHGRFGLLKYKG